MLRLRRGESVGGTWEITESTVLGRRLELPRDEGRSVGGCRARTGDALRAAAHGARCTRAAGERHGARDRSLTSCVACVRLLERPPAHREHAASSSRRSVAWGSGVASVRRPEPHAHLHAQAHAQARKLTRKRASSRTEFTRADSSAQTHALTRALTHALTHARTHARTHAPTHARGHAQAHARRLSIGRALSARALATSPHTAASTAVAAAPSGTVHHGVSEPISAT